MPETKVHEDFTITEKAPTGNDLREGSFTALIEMPLTLSPVMVSLFLVTSIVALPRTWLVIGERT